MASSPNWFVALPVPAGPWFERLRAPPRGVRLLSASDLHITVAFLGRVDEAAGRAALAQAARWPGGPVHVRLGRLVPMGHPRRPSALSALLEEGEAQVTRGILATRDAMHDAAGVAREVRPVRPHVTLARPHRKASAAEREAAVAWAAQVSLGSPQVPLEALALYTGAPGSGEARYAIRARVQLSS